MTTLCFQVLDDLEVRWGPFFIELGSQVDPKKFESKLRQELNKLWNKMKHHECNHYFFEDHDQSKMIDNVTKELMQNDLCVYNRVEKYYVYAFALDGKPFWAWSKDCDAEIVGWGNGSLR